MTKLKFFGLKCRDSHFASRSVDDYSAMNRVRIKGNEYEIDMHLHDCGVHGTELFISTGNSGAFFNEEQVRRIIAALKGFVD